MSESTSFQTPEPPPAYYYRMHDPSGWGVHCEECDRDIAGGPGYDKLAALLRAEEHSRMVHGYAGYDH